MRRKVEIVRGSVWNGEFTPYEDSRKKVDYNVAEEYIHQAREDVSNFISSIGGRKNMYLDHIVYAVKLFGPRGGLKEVRFITQGRDMTEVEFDKFIQPYGFVGAYHR